MLRTFLEWLAKWLPSPRVIPNRVGTGPYLSRWYLRGLPTMPDGSHPFTANGETKPDAIYSKKIGVYLHRFNESDGEEFHNHPFEWSVSLILVGGYYEERLGRRNEVTRRRVRTWSLNVIRANDFHRVDLIEKDAWTLFIVGPRTRDWGFWNRKYKMFVPSQTYLNMKRDGYFS